jgi:hypothetical protein
MSVIVELETVLNADFVGMFILYLSANIRMSTSDGSFVTAINRKKNAVDPKKFQSCVLNRANFCGRRKELARPRRYRHR